MKVHRAPEFLASLLNNQPMGFYSSATLVKVARRHGVKTRAVCIVRSEWTCTIEAPDDAVRLGLCVVNGLNRDHADQMLQARREQLFRSRQDFLRRTTFDRDELRTLASLGALNTFGGHRRDALWAVEEPLPDQPELFAHAAPSPGDSPLTVMDAGERLQADYDGMNLTTGPHTMVLLRPHLPEGVWRAVDLVRARNGQWVRIAGNVICRQRPGTAKGFVFVSLEDETGIANAIVAPALFERLRLTLSQEAFLLIEGRVQVIEGTIHVKATGIEGLARDVTPHAGSHDFH